MKNIITINLDYLGQLDLKMLLYLMAVTKYLKYNIFFLDEVIKKHRSSVKSPVLMNSHQF